MQTLARWGADAPGGAGGGRRDLDQAQGVAFAVHRAANWHPLHPTCLPRALVIAWLLRLRGLAADLRIGVAKPGEAPADGLLAHAWVEHGGAALAEAGASFEAYAPFDEAVSTR